MLSSTDFGVEIASSGSTYVNVVSSGTPLTSTYSLSESEVCLISNSDSANANGGSSSTTLVESSRQTSSVTNSNLPRSRYNVFTVYNWIQNTKKGYFCKICREYSKIKEGAWITIPISKKLSHKLKEKAAKHNKSESHVLAVAAREISLSNKGVSVAEMVHIQAISQAKTTKLIIRCFLKFAYYLFKTESPHTTNWEPLLNTVCQLDGKSTFRKYILESPSNAHHLSTTSITGFLDSFGSSIFISLKNELRNLSEFSIMCDEATDICNRQMLCMCIRYITNSKIVERFIACKEIHSTKAEDLKLKILEILSSYELKISNTLSVSFDGAANFSGSHSGVQALLKLENPNLSYIHCRAHLLQLVILHASKNRPIIKKCVSLCNRIYHYFSNSALRTRELNEMQTVCDGFSNKLVAQCQTRWLSCEQSISIILKHYASICFTLENIYQEGGNYFSDAGGILLELKKSSTCFTFLYLKKIFEPLAKLSKIFQSKQTTLANVSEHVMSTLAYFRNMEALLIELEFAQFSTNLKNSGLMLDNDQEDFNASKAQIAKFTNDIVQHLNAKFGDAFEALVAFTHIIENKPKHPDFSKISDFFATSSSELVYEYEQLSNNSRNFSMQYNQLLLATSKDFQEMFPNLSKIMTKCLIFPVGTASAERAFSTMNRILSSERNRLSPAHLESLMFLSIEGAEIPDSRLSSPAEITEYDNLIDTAFLEYNKASHRFH